MQKRLFVLSPCGTSLLTNQADDTERKLVGKYANTKLLKQISSEDETKLQLLSKRVREKLVSADLDLASALLHKYEGCGMQRDKLAVPSNKRSRR